jgi:putative oxidoreductase
MGGRGMLREIFETDESKTTILIRIMVGAVFLAEGIQKFVYPDALGPGRFVGLERR